MAAMTKEALRAYKTGWMQGWRRARYLEAIRPGATELARQVMMNEFARAARHTRKCLKYRWKPVRNEGNDAWMELAKPLSARKAA